METKTINNNQTRTERTLRIVINTGKARVIPAKAVPIQVRTKKKFDHLYKALPFTGL